MHNSVHHINDRLDADCNVVADDALLVDEVGDGRA
jgi:hypothetical protein